MMYYEFLWLLSWMLWYYYLRLFFNDDVGYLNIVLNWWILSCDLNSWHYPTKFKMITKDFHDKVLKACYKSYECYKDVRMLWNP